MNKYKVYNYCEWRGVDCNGTAITSLQLSGEKLDGSLPPEIAALGQSLRRLDISSNSIVELPTTFNQLVHLEYLNCSSNSFAQLPSGLGNMTLLCKHRM